MTSQDFQKRIDLTGLEDVTGSEMNQLIDTAKPAEDKGLNIVTVDTALNIPDVPDPDEELEGITPTHWRNYTWVRKPFDATGRIKVYHWNLHLEDDPDPTYLCWEELASDDATTIANNALNLANQALAENDVQDASITALTNIANEANTNANTAVTTANTANSTSNANTTAILELAAQVQDLENDIGNTTPINQGGTGATSVGQALINLGLSRVPLGSFIFRDLKGVGVNGGTFNSGAQQKRTLNDSSYSTGNLAGYAILNGDSTFDLVSGIWEIEFSAPAVRVSFHKASLYNITDGAVSCIGSSEFIEDTGSTVSNRSVGQCILSLAATKKFQINHICYATRANDGFGIATNLGGLSEIYTIVKLTYRGSV